jgi:hypothetical protein
MFKRFLVSILYPIVRPAVEAVVAASVKEAIKIAQLAAAEAVRRVNEAVAKLPPVPPA